MLIQTKFEVGDLVRKFNSDAEPSLYIRSIDVHITGTRPEITYVLEDGCEFGEKSLKLTAGEGE